MNTFRRLLHCLLALALLPGLPPPAQAAMAMAAARADAPAHAAGTVGHPGHAAATHGCHDRDAADPAPAPAAHPPGCCDGTADAGGCHCPPAGGAVLPAPPAAMAALPAHAWQTRERPGPSGRTEPPPDRPPIG